MTSQLELDFHLAMLELYGSMYAVAQYHAVKFHMMTRRHGGLRAAKMLLLHDRISEGLGALWAKGCLDATMECLVLQPRWGSLFTHRELLMAKSRLRQLGYYKTKRA